MKVLVAGVTWARGYFRPELVHVMETCDGVPRAVDFREHGTLAVAVCRQPLGSDLVKVPRTDPDERCPLCRDIADRLQGIV